MNNFLARVQGNKTYLVAITGVLTALVTLLNGQIDTAEFMRATIDCILAAAIRHGISTTNQGPPQ